MPKKILVIDDERDLVEMIATRLSAAGYAVISAFDGEEGKQKAKETPPDGIVLDVMMPKLDGYTVLKELRADEVMRTIPVIMLTAKDGMSDVCELEGATSFLTKPFDINVLVERIQEIIPNE